MPSLRFELAFEVAPLTEAVEDAIADAMAANFAEHSHVTVVSVLVEGPACVEAASNAMVELSRLGAEPKRLVDDLVSRREIARRADVSAQAVGQWIRGERNVVAPFPAPYVLGSTELWLWGEVVEALRARGRTVDAGVHFPTRRDIQFIGGELARRAAAPERAELLRAQEKGWRPAPFDARIYNSMDVAFPHAASMMRLFTWHAQRDVEVAFVLDDLHLHGDDAGDVSQSDRRQPLR